MLGPIETLLAQAIGAALPPGTTVVAGPALGPATAARVVVRAERLARLSPPGGEPRLVPDGAWLSRRHSLAPDVAPAGNRRVFTLPPDAFPLIEEVQAPPGRRAARGDDYVVDDRTLRFAADQAGPIEVLTRGGPAVGWHDRAPAELWIGIVAQAASFVSADALLASALAAGMATLTGQEVVTLAWAAPAGLRLRLLSLCVLLDGVEREATENDGTHWAQVSGRLRLLGELETLLATGEAPLSGVIGEIDTVLTEWPGGRQTSLRSG